MSIVRLLVGITCALAFAARPTYAQVAAPTTLTGGLFGRQAPRDTAQPSQGLTLQLSGNSGQDRNTDSDGNPLAPNTFGALQSGTISGVDATAIYAMNRGLTTMSSIGRGYANYGSQGVGRIVGASGSLQGNFALSDRNGLVVDSSISYDPAVLFDAFGPVADQIDTGAVPGASPTQGVTDSQWLSLIGTSGLSHRWTTRQQSVVTGTVSRRGPQQGIGFVSTTKGAAARHSWAARERVALDFGYRIDGQDQSTATTTSTFYTQAGDLTLHLDRRISSTRSVRVSLGTGATFVRAPSDVTRADVTFVVPTFSVLARMNLVRTWELAVDARRDITVLRGLSPDVFRADAASVRIAGTPVARLQFDLSAGASRGRSESSDLGSFEMLTAVAQAQFAISRHAAISTSVNHYIHRLRDLATLDPLFPSAFTRSSFRVGVTLWLPVIGRS